MADMTMVKADEHESTVFSRCKGLTRKGAVCKNRPNDNGFCHLHQKDTLEGPANPS